MSNGATKHAAERPWGEPIIMVEEYSHDLSLKLNSHEVGLKLDSQELCCPAHVIERIRTVINVRKQVRADTTDLLERLGYTILLEPIIVKNFPTDAAFKALMELNSTLKISKHGKGGLKIELRTIEERSQAKWILESRGCDTSLDEEEPIIIAGGKSDEIKIQSDEIRAQLEFKLEGSFEVTVEGAQISFIPKKKVRAEVKALLESLRCTLLPELIIVKNFPKTKTLEAIMELGSSLKIIKREGHGFELQLQTESARKQAERILAEQDSEASSNE